MFKMTFTLLLTCVLLGPHSDFEWLTYAFECDDGCAIIDDFLDDDYCDCSQCEDESAWDCDSCMLKCPDSCGDYTECPDFPCDDGCRIPKAHVNDSVCDCSNCEDESAWDCGTCFNGCPSTCGEFFQCSGTPYTPTESTTTEEPTTTGVKPTTERPITVGPTTTTPKNPSTSTKQSTAEPSTEKPTTTSSNKPSTEKPITEGPITSMPSTSGTEDSGGDKSKFGIWVVVLGGIGAVLLFALAGIGLYVAYGKYKRPTETGQFVADELECARVGDSEQHSEGGGHPEFVSPPIVTVTVAAMGPQKTCGEAVERLRSASELLIDTQPEGVRQSEAHSTQGGTTHGGDKGLVGDAVADADVEDEMLYFAGSDWPTAGDYKTE